MALKRKKSKKIQNQSSHFRKYGIFKARTPVIDQNVGESFGHGLSACFVSSYKHL